MTGAVIFDMDGTLIDSEPIHYKAVTLLSKKLRIPLETTYNEKFVGTDYETIWKRNIKKYNIAVPLNQLMKMQNEITYRCFSEMKLKESSGVTAFIRKLRKNNIRTAVASASPENIITLILKNLNIMMYMDAVCGIESVRYSKPAPDLFLLAAERLSVAPENCIVIEDSAIGVSAAKRAGMKCILLRNTYTSPEALEKADAVINSFDEIDFWKMIRLPGSEAL